MRTKLNLLLALALTLPLSSAMAQPSVSGATTSLYATVSDPFAVSFGADGALYVGRDNYGTGGSNEEPLKIRRIGSGGAPVTEFGAEAIPDPDAVIVDRAGVASGVAGAVLVGGLTGSDTGQITRIAPDGTVTVLFGPSSLYSNPNGFAFDALGRLLFTETAQGRVYRTDGGTPTLLFNLSAAFSIATDAADRIVVSPASNPGRMSLYSADGTLSNANFAAIRPASPLARGPGGMWTTDLHGITESGGLIRVALDGTTTTLGSGFGDIIGLTFGPDGALYASDFAGDRVWRIAPLPQQWSTNTLPSGLISWWNADGNTLDVTGLNPASSSGQTYGTGRFGQAFHFDGINQSVAAPGSASLDQWTQFTLEAWMKLDQTADVFNDAPGRMVINRVGNPNDQVNYNQGYQFGFWNNARNLVLAFNTNGQAWPGVYTEVVLPASLPTNVWLHYVATYDHNAVMLYLNGVPLKTNVIGAATVAHSTSSFRIGQDDNGNCPFPGSIDDVRVYTRALSKSEIAYLYQGPTTPVTQGLKFHLDANDVNGGSNPADSAPVSTWRDSSGFGLDAPPLFGVAPVYRTNALNGRAGVDFSLSGSDSLATAFTSQLNFTNCTIFVVGNHADSGTHISISAATLMQEICIFDKGIQHHSSPYHYIYRSHQDAPAGFYIHAGLFGVKAGQLESFINGVASSTGFVFGQQSPTVDDVADYVPVARQAILGWRNSDANGNLPVAGENFGGVICEVLAYDRQLSESEVDAVNFFLANKYGLSVTPIPPVLQLVPAASETVALGWDSTIGRQYQLQSATNLAAASWYSEGTPLNGTGGLLTISLPTDAQPRQFFRLLLLEN